MNEKELRDELFTALHGYKSDNLCAIQADRLINKARECYLSHPNNAKVLVEQTHAALDRAALMEKERNEAMAACAEMRESLRHCQHDHSYGVKVGGTFLPRTYTCPRCLADKEDLGRGWHSPEEWEKLEACCAEMRKALEAMLKRFNPTGPYDLSEPVHTARVLLDKHK